MRAKLNKRGVSPLIATVLLISFAVALGSVVLNWGRNIDISKPGDKCAGINIEIRDIDASQVCYSVSGNDAYINFIIDNSGNTDIDGLGIWIVGEKGTKLLDFNDLSIKKGELLDIKDTTVKYNFNTYGAIKHIQFFPKVKINDSLDICARSSVKVDKIGICQT
jgi:flagellin-like protein|tara:strand:- start:28650 stop:29141 length:492 start_codon:yes stop_codon:yes gene_type:complete